MKKRRVLVLTHPDLVPPEVASSLTAREAFDIKTEADVISTLRKIGHDVHVLGVQWELRPVREAVDVLKPDIVFNLLEEPANSPWPDNDPLHFRISGNYLGAPRTFDLKFDLTKATARNALVLPAAPAVSVLRCSQSKL